jgi:prolyl oligopeptidase
MNSRTDAADSTDPYAWLEEVEGEDALAWVSARNDEAATELTESPRFSELNDQILEVLDSTEKIPDVVQRGDHLYNYWIDAEHPRGLWRRTTWASYRERDPEWEILLDLDALAAAEDEAWVWHGARVLRPSWDKALIALSRGGSDADVIREFDLTTGEFVADGFVLEESKGVALWADTTGDTLLVARDFGEGSMTESRWRRPRRSSRARSSTSASAPGWTSPRASSARSSPVRWASSTRRSTSSATVSSSASTCPRPRAWTCTGSG